MKKPSPWIWHCQFCGQFMKAIGGDMVGFRAKVKCLECGRVNHIVLPIQSEETPSQPSSGANDSPICNIGKAGEHPSS